MSIRSLALLQSPPYTQQLYFFSLLLFYFILKIILRIVLDISVLSFNLVIINYDYDYVWTTTDVFTGF